MNARRYLPVAVIVVLLLIVVRSVLFVVPEGEQVIITRLGKPVREPIPEAGLHVKWPLVEKVNRFERRWLAWDGDANQMPTLDKRFIWVNTFARWRIADPLLFFQRVRDERGAQTRLDDILDGETRKAIANMKLIEAVRTRNREFAVLAGSIVGAEVDPPEPISVGREVIVREILERASAETAELGIELVDVRFKRLNYVEEVRRSVYDRMISERQKIRDKFRSEGQGRSAEIRGTKDKELKRIRSEAYRSAQEIRGAADATATRIYADSFGRDPEFYSFVRTLEAYRDAVGEEETLVMSTDSEFYQFLRSVR
jgi:membrane protease subunit HflC